jgi:SAM-dependent methyltransferase
MTTVTTAQVRAFFDAEARNGRRLLPDPATASGLGSYVKYCCATTLMAEPGVRRVIDVGCSVGSIEALFRQQYPDRTRDTLVEGVDISGEAIRRAAGLDLGNCHFRLYDGVTLPHASAQFDLAIAVEVIEHVEHKSHFVSEILRVLRPGGRLFLTTPNPQCWALRAEDLIERLARWCVRRPAPAKDDFIPLDDLSRLLASAGFRPVGPGPGAWPMWPRLYVSLYGWGVIPPLPPRALAHYQRLCISALSRVPLRGFLGMRLGWSTSALWQKPDETQEPLEPHKSLKSREVREPREPGADA